jgi:hypothetical protein
MASATRQRSKIRSILAMVAVAFLSFPPAQALPVALPAPLPAPLPIASAKEAKPLISRQALSAEQLSVYSVVLAAWMDNDQGTHPVHLAIQTTPFALSDMDSDCGRNLRMTEGSTREVHQFRPEDLKTLLPSKVELVDPNNQGKEVAENDPHTSIRKGKSIETAVENAFAHGLTTLGEIHFDKSHTHAIVSYNFSCGATCGNGSTAILERKDGAWHILSHCSVSVA